MKKRGKEEGERKGPQDLARASYLSELHHFLNFLLHQPTMPDSPVYIGTAFVAGVCLAIVYHDLIAPSHCDTESTADRSEPTARAGPPAIVEGIEGCIGNTPLFRIKSLSEETGCEILGKAEVCILFCTATTTKLTRTSSSSMAPDRARKIGSH